MAEELQYIQVDGEYLAFPVSMSDEDIATAIESVPPRQEPELTEMPPVYEGADAMPSGAVMQGMTPQFEESSKGQLQAGELGDMLTPARAIKQAVTGENQMTDQVRQAVDAGRDWTNMPGIKGWGGFLESRLGTALAGGENDAQIIAANAGLDMSDPNQVTKDEKGNWWFKDKESGEWFVRQPGFGVDDAIGMAINMTPFGRIAAGVGKAAPMISKLSPIIDGFFKGAGIKGVVAREAGIGIAQELAQTGAGSEKGLIEQAQDIALGTGMGAAVPAFARTGETLGKADIADLARKARNGDPQAIQALQGVDQNMLKAVNTEMDRMMDPSEILSDVARRGSISPEERVRLARSLDLNEDAVEAIVSNRLEDVTNLSFMTSRDADKTKMLIDAAGFADEQHSNLMKIGARTDEMFERLDAPDLGELEPRVRKAFADDIEQLENIEAQTYDVVKGLVPEDTPAEVLGTLDYLDDLKRTKAFVSPGEGFKPQGSDKVGLSQTYNEVYDMLQLPYQKTTKASRDPFKGVTPAKTEWVRGKPTWQQLNRATQLVGSRIKDMTFSNAEQGAAKHLYSKLAKDREASLRALQDAGTAPAGSVDAFNQALAATTKRKGVEQNAQYVLGRRLDKDIIELADSASAQARKAGVAKFAKAVEAMPDSVRGEYLRGAILRGIMNTSDKTNFDYKRVNKIYRAFSENPRLKKLAEDNIGPHALDAIEVARDFGAIADGIFLGMDKKFPGADDAMIANIAERKIGMVRGLVEKFAGVPVGLMGSAFIPTKGGQGSLAANVASIGIAKEFLSATKFQQGRMQYVKSLLQDPAFEKLAISEMGNKAIEEFAGSKKMQIFLKQMGEASSTKDAERVLLNILRSDKEENK